MSELLDRRAQKKAQTRELIRTVAHRMFAEQGFEAVTIADVARASDVAVQTVFNHFATKEELFFDGRVPWVEGPAAAVRDRGAEEAPLTALRRYLVEVIGALVSSMATEERRRYVATVQGSEALMAQERENVFEAERRLTEALTEAWSDDSRTTGPVPAEPGLAAALTAAVWLSAGRALVVEQRPRVAAGACPRELSAAVESVADGLLSQLEGASEFIHGVSVRTVVGGTVSTDTGWPQQARHAG